MKKFCLMMLCICVSSGVYAQTYSASLDQQDAVEEAQPSSIDLLKRSLAASANETPASAKQVSTGTAVAKPAAVQKPAPKEQPIDPTVPVPSAKITTIESDIEQNNALEEGERGGTPKAASSAVAVESQAAVSNAPAAAERETVVQAELDYAARMLQQAKQNSTAERFIPQAASKTAQEEPQQPSTAAKRPFNPNDFRPGVDWVKNNSTHFFIYTQKREGGIGSSNMGMIFESAYATLRRNIPWMMSDKVRVFVYQDHASYLQHEPNAKAWTRALAYPTRGEIVVYDEPGKQQELKEVFTHELVHIFTQKFFDKYKTGRLMTPTWLDEGLAVYMEDQAYNGMKGGPWSNDLKTLNFQRSPETQVANFGSTSMFGSSRSTSNSFGRKKQGPVLYLMPFDQFMADGSLETMEGRNKTQDWYFQAYAMVRFLLNPAGSTSPSNRMQFEQFTRLMAQGEQVRDPNTGFPMRGRDGKPIYQPYSVEKAMGRAYRYGNAANFEDNFWRWANNQ